MKYAVNYHSSFKHLDTVDELILQYNKDKQRAALLKYVKENTREDLRIVVAAEAMEDLSAEDIDIFVAVKEVHANIAVRIGLQHRELMVDFIEKEIPFFFDVFVDSWDMLNGMIKYGVSDVYIVNEFAFELPRIREICKEVNIRIFPNVSQSTDKLHTLPTITSFFVRPEDISFYEQYVDICEFFGTVDRNDVLYRIYTSGTWAGDLRELIIGLKENVPNVSIVPYFGERRSKCKKVCSYGKCNLCNQITDLAISLNNNGVGIKYE